MSPAKILMMLGFALFILGVVLGYAPNLLGWFGKLPGDLRIEREHGVIFIPITSMIVISMVLTLLLNLFFRR